MSEVSFAVCFLSGASWASARHELDSTDVQGTPLLSIDVRLRRYAAREIANREAYGHRVDELSREISSAFRCEEVFIPSVMVLPLVAILPILAIVPVHLIDSNFQVHVVNP